MYQQVPAIAQQAYHYTSERHVYTPSFMLTTRIITSLDHTASEYIVLPVVLTAIIIGRCEY